MTNAATAFGLETDKPTAGGEIQTQRVYFSADDATAAFVGDPLIADQTNGGDSLGTPAVVVAQDATVALLGILVAMATDRSNGGSIDDLKYRPASTERYGLAIVVGQRQKTFIVREDSVGAALTADSVGLSCDLIYAAGDTDTGKSGVYLDSSTAGATGQVTLLEPLQTIDNALGDNCVWRVQINESLFE
jgi:hypothetical protein